MKIMNKGNIVAMVFATTLFALLAACHNVVTVESVMATEILRLFTSGGNNLKTRILQQ